MKKIISTFLLLCFVKISVFAVDFDSSVDAEIRKNNNVDSSELPPLPKAAPTEVQNIPAVKEIPKTSYNVTGKTYTVKGGTKLILSSKSSIADWQKVGTKISFVAQQGITTKEGAIVPAGTVFRGTITDSHRPQITGNGGLVELKIDEMYYNGVLSNIEAKVLAVNSKNIHKSDIKGERRYCKNFSKAMTPGKKSFKATKKCAKALAPIPVVNILGLIPLAGGTVIYVVNLVAAPVVSLFSKGGTLSLPAGTKFQVKFTKDTQIYG